MDQNILEYLHELEIDFEELKKLDSQAQLKLFKTKYHKLIQEWHPDKAAQKAGFSKEYMENKFKAIHHAYKMLTDTQYREKEKSRARGGQQPNLHAVINVNLSFEQAYFGSKTTVTFNATHLDAEGKPITVDTDKSIHFSVDVVEVNIPERTVHGTKVRIPGKGLKQGDRQGDLIFVINVAPHPKWRLNPEDLHEFRTDETVDLDLMISGGKFEVLTLWGIKTFRIPAGSKPGDEITLLKLGKDKLGKHIIKITPKFPDKEELKTKPAWQKLGVNWKEEEELDEAEKSDEEEYEELFEELGGYQESESPYKYIFRQTT